MDATLLTSLMSCFRKSEFRFVNLYVPIGGKGNALECGSLVHVFLEYYNRSIIKGISKSQAAGLAFAAAETYIQGCKYCTDFIATPENPKPSCNHKVNEFPGLHNTPKDNETKPIRIGWAWVLDSCQQYLDHYKNDHWIPLEVEKVKSKILYEDENIIILWKAKLDLTVDTNQGIFPMDHKTMKQNRDTTSMNNQFIGQCLIEGTRSIVIDKFGFQTSLKPAEKFIRNMISYDASRLLEWQSEILPYWAYKLLEVNEDGYYPPNFTQCEGKYGKCEFHDICEASVDMRETILKQKFKVGEEWNPTNDEEA